MRDRSSEELDGVLQAFPDVFEKEVGQPLDPKAFVEILSTMVIEKAEQMIRQRFFDYKPQDIGILIERFKNGQTTIERGEVLELASEPKAPNEHVPESHGSGPIRPNAKQRGKRVQRLPSETPS